jgi:hypothetical protein
MGFLKQPGDWFDCPARIQFEIADYWHFYIITGYWITDEKAWEPTKTTDNTTSLHFLALFYFKVTQWTTNLLCIMHRVWKGRGNITS